jgi:DNA adenine methylase
MNEQDHHKLLTALRQCRGKVLVSSYDSTLYRTILHDWQCLEKETHVQLSNSGGHRRELLWKNW